MSDTTEQPEVTPESKQIRTLDDRLGKFRSGSTDGVPNADAMGKPQLNTKWEDNESVYTNRTVAPIDNVHDAWWLEDFYKKSDVGNLKSLDGKRTLSGSELGGGNIGGTHYIFRASSGGSDNPTVGGAGETPPEFHRTRPGTLQLGTQTGQLVSVIMGSLPGKTGNLSSRKALFSCPLGMQLTMTTAGSDLVGQSFRFKHLSILYKKDNEEVKYGAIVENYKWKNENRLGLSGEFDPNTGGFDPTNWFGSAQIGNGWVKKPSIGGSLYSFISEDEIGILESNVGYKAVGMIMSWNAAANHALNIYDLCPVFSTGEIPSAKSRRIIQPPMLFSESLNVKSYRLV
jgi:hypothetical protein